MVEKFHLRVRESGGVEAEGGGSAGRGVVHPAAGSLTEVLWQRAERHPEREVYLFLENGETEGARLTYGGLRDGAAAVAAELERRGVVRGERALLVFPPGPEFIVTFFGCLEAGVVAVPVYPPRTGRRPDERFRRILEDAEPAALLCRGELLARRERLARQVPEAVELPWIPVDDLVEGRHGAHAGERSAPGPDDLAFLQYTSGSTSAPKGVMVRHRDLVRNQEMIAGAFGLEGRSVVVSWLPLYHDMGLIGGVLAPLYVGARCVFMAPVAFVQRPVRWLRAIERYRATVSGGPDFGYRLCVEQIPEEVRRELDLSSWRVAFDGSEPVRAGTLEAFAEAFAPSGFRRESLYPCYGLAEATLFVSGGDRGRRPEIRRLAAAGLETGRARPAAPGEREAPLVSCGRPWGGTEVAVVEPESGRPLPDGRIGEVWVRGPAVAGGYWRRPGESARGFEARTVAGDGPYLRTGDLAFRAGGELYVTGRIKDLLILRGRNLYPQDLERSAAEAHPALREDAVAAFSVEAEGAERLVLVAEVGRREGEAAEEIVAAVEEAVAADHEIAVRDLVLVGRRGVAKTTSGKVRRAETRRRYLAGELPVVFRSLGAERGPATPERERVALSPAALEVAGELRRRLAGVLELGPDEPAPGRRLTALGVDSLAAARIAAEIEEVWRVSIPTVELLEGPTVGELAARIAASPRPTPDPALDRPADPAPDRIGPGPHPLSHGQEALWYLERLAPVPGVYTIAIAGRVVGAFDPEAFVRALRRLVGRHPVLRTTVTETDAGPVQTVSEEPRIDCALLRSDRVDGAGVEADGEPGRGLRRRMARDAHAPFDLAAGPPVRARLYRDAAERWHLLLAVHHLVADLGSFRVLAPELDALYREELGGPPAPASAGPSYFAHVLARRQALAGAEGERLAGWWESALGGGLPELDLPTDRPRPPVQSFRGVSARTRIPSAAAAPFRRLLRERGATLSAGLTALYQAFLHRWSGQDRVLIGVPTSGRDLAADRDLVGYLVNPVVVAGAMADGPALGELVDRARRELLAALDHRDFPFPLLVRRLGADRDPSRPPVFQAMLVVQQAADASLAAFSLGDPSSRLRLGGLELAPVVLPEERSQVDVRLTVAEAGGDLVVELQLDAALFDRTTAGRMLRALGALLAGAGEPERPVAALPLIPAEERHAVLVEWTGASGPAPSGRLHDPFFTASRRHPDRPAVVCDGEVVSYGELAARARRRAERLRRLGVGPEVPVAVCLERTPELVATLLGVLAAGGAYVPVDPALPAARKDLLVRDVDAVLVVAEPEAVPADLPVRVVRPSELDGGGPAEPPAAAPEAEPLPDHLAYVIYTSGSTGTPKGVAISHRNGAALLAWALEAFGTEELERTLAATSVGFDLSVFELFAPLAAGGTVVLAGSILDLPRVGERGRPTLVNTVPSALAELVRQRTPPPGIATVNLAGEPLGAELADRLHAEIPGLRLLNLYGPSETTTYSTWSAVAGAGRTGPPAIGRPVAGDRAWVVDPELAPVPVGVAGELVLGGAGVSRGYRRRPAATAERFVPDPFGDGAGARLYRTGDLARWRPDGELEFLGRIDHQVKVRGVRIEPGEVEAALVAHPDVAEAAVTAAAGGTALAAHLVAAPGRRPAPAALEAALATVLPKALVPSLWRLWDRLPRTASGKVDARALADSPAGLSPEVGAGAQVGGGEPGAAPPRSPVEEAVVELFREVLELPAGSAVGVHDDLFRWGGHSLSAVRLAGRLRDLFGVEVPLAEILRQPTPAALAAAVGRGGTAEPIPPAEGEPPLSFAQERLWFLHRLDPASPLYAMPAELELDGDLDAAALARTLLRIRRRHQPLGVRVRVRERDGVAVPERVGDGAGRLPVIDLSGLPASVARARAKELAREEARRPFDLGAGPPVRTLLVRTAEREHRLLLTLHHIAADGWSLERVLPAEIEAVYRSEVTGEAVPLPELPIAYGDYAAWQRRRLSGRPLERLLEHWRGRLDALPPLELPSDRPRAARRGHRGAVRPVAVAPDLVDALRAVARRRGVTLFSVLVAAYQVLLARLAGADDLAVGVPHANRNRSEVEPLVGMFVNTLVLRAGLPPALRFDEHLERAHRTAIDAYAHAELPFERLVDALAPERSLHRPPLASVFLSLDAGTGGDGWTLDLPGLRARAREVSTGTAKFDLSLILRRREGGLVGSLTYAADLFDPTTAERWCRAYGRLLEAAAADPAVPLGALPVMGPAERFQLLVEWPQGPGGRGAAAGSTRWTGGVAAAVAERARERPDAVAVRTADRTVTFGELARRASQIAAGLGALGGAPGGRGAGPGRIVGVCLDRSPDLVAALLGVLWSGAAYLPLDPSDPEDRLELLVRDADPSWVLTREHREVFEAAGARVAAPEELTAVEPSAGAAPTAPAAVDRADLAYVLYTSGSTGRPKGVMVAHGGLAAYLDWAGSDLLRGAEVPFIGRIGFDASLKQVFAPLVAGRSVRIPPVGAERPGRLTEALAGTPRLVLNLVPSVWRPWLEALERGELAPPDGLERLLLGGEEIGDGLVEATARALPGVEIVNLYGPTEATANASAGAVVPGEPAHLGRPVAGARVHLVGADLRPVPLGAAGEIAVSGEAVARGYLGRPAGTAERFVPDPFGPPGGRLYRTGDRARRRPDGTLRFLGRIDLQVKIRGHRIEPEEVEAVLLRRPGVRGAAVVQRRGAAGEPVLAAFVEPAGVDVEALRRELADRLPGWMVPAVIVALDRLPRQSAGKVDRRALPDPEIAPSAAGTAPPADGLEEIVARAFAETLAPGRPVARTDDFFALGGHSLLAGRVVARIAESCGVELPLRSLFEAPTVAGCAEAVRRLRGASSPPPPVEPGPEADSVLDAMPGGADEEEAPASFAQRRLWFLDRLVPGSPAYNVAAVARVRGALGAAELAGALHRVVRRHEPLRTRLRERAGEPVQVIGRTGWPPPLTVDLTGLPPVHRGPEAERVGTREARLPFDLARGPLGRAVLVRRAPEDHEILLTLHHAVTDGWSMAIVLEEIAGALGSAPPPAPLPVRYADYARWQRRWLTEDALAGQLDYWRRRLDGVTPLSLPTDRPRPPVRGFRGATVPVRVPGSVATAVRDGLRTADGRRPTRFMVLTAAFQALLARLAGAGDLTVSTPVANRRRPELEPLVGLFVNTLVLRADMADDPPFGEHLGRVQDACLGAYDHQDLPFERLVEVLEPERDLSRPPLAQAMIALRGGASGPAGDGTAALSPAGRGTGTAKLDLTLFLGEPADGSEGLEGEIEYSTELFDETTVRRWAAALATLLAGAVREPGRRLGDLPLASAAERHQVLAEWSGAGVSAAGVHGRAVHGRAGAGATLHGRVAEAAARHPERVAVVAGGRHLTYGALWRRAEEVARGLRSLGVGAGDRVGVALARGPELVPGLLAVLEIGAAYVPLDPGYPEERLAFMLEDSGCAALLLEDAVAETLGEMPQGVPRIRVDGLGAAVDGEPDPPAAEVDPEALAYLIYTSGSTGRPKGVAIAHRSAVALLDWAAERLEPDDLSRVLATTSICFDLSVFELFAPLVHGGTAVLIDDALSIASAPAAAAVSLVNTVPTVLEEVLRGGPLEGPVRVVGLAGEPLPAALVARLEDQGVPRVLNLYGPSESTTYSTCAVVSAGSPGGGLALPPPIGRPVAGTLSWVVDRRLRPVPLGAPGELILGGEGLAHGYFGRPGRTAGAFVPSPFGSAGARLYRTGDLVRLRPDGQLQFLGRIDRQVKIRGFRVELGEVEAALRSHGAVSEAVADARSTAAGDRRLVAWVSTREAELDTVALRRGLAERLPEFLVPSSIVRVGAFPRTPSGKIDRDALPDPSDEAAGAPGVVDLPRSPLEEAVADLWRDLLGLEAVDRTDDFLAVGGHSLLVTRLAAAVRETFGVDLPLATLFRASTVAEQAREIAARRGDGPGADRPPLVPLAPAVRRRGVPLAPGQERLLFLQRLQPESASYNLTLALRLDGPLDAPALHRAAGALVARHEALRTRFVAVPGERGGPREELQQALAPYRPGLPVVDCTALPAGVRERALDGVLSRWARRPFDLEAGRLLRPLLVRSGPESHRLALTQHHAVSDGWSQGVLLGDLAAAYEAARSGRESGVAEPAPFQQGDVAAWQRSWVDGGGLDGSLDVWRSRLAGLGPLDLPTDRPRPAERSERGAGQPVRLDAGAVDAARSLGRRCGATLFMVLVAGLQAVLGRVAYATDVAVGAPVANRDRPGTEGVVGFLVNTLVLRTDLSGDPDVRRLLERVREVALEAYAHQDVPFERVVDAVRPERDLGRTPLFGVLFALQDAIAPVSRIGEAAAAVETVPTGVTKFDLTISLRRSPDREGGGLVGTVEHSTDLFDPTTVRRLVGLWRTLLVEAAAAPERPLSSCAMLAPAQRHQLVHELGAPRRRAGRPEPLYRRFVAHAARRPDAIALVSGGRRITYGELVRRARRCAARLTAEGIGPEDLVAILCRRSPAWVTAVLATHAAGAAYLPLDPAHPSERLRLTLEDSGARLVVVEEETAAVVPDGAPPVWQLDRLVAPGGPEGPDRPIPHRSLAYVIYTSGSSGRPKGVAVDQRSLARLYDAAAPWLQFRPEDCVLQLHSTAFDFSVWELWSALAHGATLVLASDDATVAQDELLDLIERERLTVVGQTPSVFYRLVDLDGRSPGRLEALRAIGLGGEALAPGRLAPWIARRGDRRPRLLNLYGLTETTVLATVRPIRRSDTTDGALGSPLGWQMTDSALHVLDRSGRPVPLGVPGELCVGGEAPSRGYLGLPSRTAERWVPDPWSREPGGRLLRTGDLGRRTADGGVEFLGRLDDQVQVRGHRIELGEVEAALLGCPGVSQAAVVARPDPEGSVRLVGYVVRGDGPRPDEAALRQGLAERVPRAVLPAAFVFLERLPLTTSGKVDRRALPDPGSGRREASARYAPPRTELERRIAGIWSEVLEVDRVGVHDSFFDLGGHSLLLARVHRRLCEALGRNLPMVELFRHGTVAALAAHLEADARGGGATAEAAASGDEAGAPAPQERAARRRRRTADRRAARRAALGREEES